ncbi:polysaccharide deacetylase family protein [Kiritimatiellaeota bacterium B1221]|nr:polysaccharide deacetylase family protein [Kiritimatiellaeota bacterium B1221]
MKNPIPFNERDSFWHEKLQFLKGKWPSFVFGLGRGGCLPVFKFSRITRQELEPYLIYLMENGYRTIQSAEMEAFIEGNRKPDPKEVVLCFDHAWASVWTVVAPLLERYGFKAITYAIPGRISELPALRPVWGQPGHDPDVDYTKNPFCSWGELLALQKRGLVDVQSNSWSHGYIFSHDKFLRLIQPETFLPPLNWPLLNESGAQLKTLSNRNVFHPLLPVRSRLSDGVRHDVDPMVVKAIHDDPDVAPFLYKKYFLQIETPEEQLHAISYELTQSREDLEKRLPTKVTQICFPWGVCGKIAYSLLEESGYRSAIAEKSAAKFAVTPGQNSYEIGRLTYPFIRTLPGRSRKLYLRIRQEHSRRAFS